MWCGTAATATHAQSRWNIRSRFQASSRKRQRAICRSSEISGLTMSRAVNVAITCSPLRLRTLSILCSGFRFAMAPLLNVLHTCSITLCGNLSAYLRTTFFFLFFFCAQHGHYDLCMGLAWRCGARSQIPHDTFFLSPHSWHDQPRHYHIFGYLS
jgi:hypothetical protein